MKGTSSSLTTVKNVIIHKVTWEDDESFQKLCSLQNFN